MNKQYEVKNPTEFKIVIDDILDWYLNSNLSALIICLQGDLGVGKTTFTQELAKRLGVVDIVTSPTFTIMKQYEIEDKNFDLLVHIDAYRIDGEEELLPLHLEPLFNRPKTVVCIEWPEKMASIIPSVAVNIALSIEEEDRRQVVVSTN